MTITVALHHSSNYKYSDLTTLGVQTIRLRPATHSRSAIQSYSLTIHPEKHFINWQQDAFGNFLARVVFPDKVSDFKVEVDLITEIRVFNPFDFFLEDSAKLAPFVYDPDLRDELLPYLEIKEDGPLLKHMVEKVEKNKNTIDFLVEVNQKLNQTLKYLVRMEPGVQPCEETLQLQSGSCRDMAWLLCQAFRHLGLATRFVSGYLIQLVQDEKSVVGPSGADKDFTDLHAWTEIYLPGAGWVGLDPTSGLFAGEGHIPLCCTPNPSSAAPITGTLEVGIESTFTHDMSVSRIAETPRVTKPYSEEQWQLIDELGKKVDGELKKNDVRLTLGGEPTFVSATDRENLAWHYEALGSDKKKLGKEMLARLKERFAPNGLNMFVQGKWYPGEILPRWAMPCYWRPCGEPLWLKQNLLADPDTKHGHTLATAQRFLSELAVTLGIPSDYILPAHEDTPFYLWKEQKLPEFDEILNCDAYKKAERERLQTLLNQNLKEPIGFVLPLHFSYPKQQWISNHWQFKSNHLILLTGDSPMGYRLPLGSLPTPKEAKDELYPERSTLDHSGDVPSHQALMKQLESTKPVDDKSFKKHPNGMIKTALCAQVRNETLHLFLPPTVLIEHFLELIATIEHIATKLNIPVALEGYTPPLNQHLSHFSITPDPGVLEINVQPATNWENLKHITFSVYEQARLALLSSEKYMLDGRRVGTGGGNHIVLGAAKPEDSPFLRRPDLLGSMVTFWQNHPALSYLFSGQYIGPTSQAPRIDEARHDSLYELEIALQQIPKDKKTPLWHIDRLFRNLLVDLTGNTHRAEFCIDKLYNPSSERGRLGLLEMRGFEMPPNPKMSLVQNLLITACVALFWEKPYPGNLVRWGTRLHDQFMLPYFLKEDLNNVLEHLNHYGFDFHPEWFLPFFEFRFPQCGQVQINNITLTLNNALEPWPVMGEEQSDGGTSRAVDSSVERLQIMARGLVQGRHMITCNGRLVPMSPTSSLDTQVAGIRFKAWSQPYSLHPKLPAHKRLVFDIIDTQLKRSLGGFCYHVAHPGGRSHETYPVNENEAEGRRMARFEPMGHSPGTIELPRKERNDEFPYTLDLRFNPN